MTREHRKLVNDLRKLALSFGIDARAVKETKVRRNELYKDPSGPDSPKWIVHLTNWCEKFQHHLLFDQNKMDLGRVQYTHDTRPPTVAGSACSGPGLYECEAVSSSFRIAL
jgi:hypothetical protein